MKFLNIISTALKAAFSIPKYNIFIGAKSFFYLSYCTDKYIKTLKILLIDIIVRVLMLLCIN